MANVNVTIDGVTGSVPAGSTVLEAAQHMNIDIPTLCHHPAIEPIGACRICLVEVEKQRTLQPACTFPATEGMVVHTKSPKVVEARRFVLQLLFSERNHFCMFCQVSGNCDLQSLAYEYGLDHWEYDRAFPKMPIDASRKYFVMDHNRCILCRQCIRVCDELVGNATLGVKQRGSSTMIIADMDVPFGESSCVACGTCLQVCPVGALMDRASAYMDKDAEYERVKSRCTGCCIGCGVELVIHNDRVIRIEGDWDAEPNHGLLCEIGRFGLIYDSRLRLKEPMIKAEGGWITATWDEALAKVAEGLGEADQVCSIVSGYASTEGAQAIADNLPGEAYMMEAVAPATGDPISALDEADLYVMVNTDLTQDYQVAGFAIKRGIRHRAAELVIVDEGENGFDSWAAAKFTPDQIDEIVDRAGKAELPAIIYDHAGAEVARTLAESLPAAKLVSFAQGSNARGIAGVGISESFSANGASAYYVLAAEAASVTCEVEEALQDADFVVVQASFCDPWLDLADVILPTPVPYEKSGTFITAEGDHRQTVGAIKTELPSEVEVVERVGALL